MFYYTCAPYLVLPISPSLLLDLIYCILQHIPQSTPCIPLNNLLLQSLLLHQSHSHNLLRQSSFSSIFIHKTPALANLLLNKYSFIQNPRSSKSPSKQIFLYTKPPLYCMAHNPGSWSCITNVRLYNLCARSRTI